MSSHTTLSGHRTTSNVLSLLTTDPSIDSFPEQSIVLLLSRPKVGKSTLVGSSEKVLRLDLDRSGGTPGQKGPRLPPRDHVGLDWATLENIKSELIKSRKNPEHPLAKVKIVAIDTLTAMVSMATRRVEKDEGKPFHDTDGRRSWNIAFGYIVKFIEDLRDAGFGVWILAHITEQRKPMGADEARVEEDLAISNGLWARLHWILDATVCLERIDKLEKVPQFNAQGDPIKTPSGEILTKNQIKNSWRLVFRTDRVTEPIHKVLGFRDTTLSIPNNLDLPTLDAKDPESITSFFAFDTILATMKGSL